MVGVWVSHLVRSFLHPDDVAVGACAVRFGTTDPFLRLKSPGDDRSSLSALDVMVFRCVVFGRENTSPSVSCHFSAFASVLMGSFGYGDATQVPTICGDIGFRNFFLLSSFRF